MAEFSYELDKDFDYTIDEKGNSFIALRKIKWGNSSEFRLDLRKWFNKGGLIWIMWNKMMFSWKNLIPFFL